MPFDPDTTSTAEVASQPSDWEAVIARLPELEAMLPSRAAVLGCGTSYYMAQAYAALRELSGQGETTPGRQRASVEARLRCGPGHQPLGHHDRGN